jgi:hypothetical protein
MSGITIRLSVLPHCPQGHSKNTTNRMAVPFCAPGPLVSLEDALRIHYERSGGLAGPAMRRSQVVDTDALTAQEGHELERLVASSRFTEHSAQRGGAAPGVGPDMFRYRLTLEKEGQRHVVNFSDADMPESLQPLVEWLTRKTGG